jgi:nitrate reductase NapE component
MPAGAVLPTASDAAAIAALPPSIRAVYLDVFTAALHPVFLSAAVIGAFGFVLTWCLKEVPLQGGERSEGIGETFAMPHDATSLHELELIVTRLALREHRWETYRRIAERTGVSLAPDEMWLLVRLCRGAGALAGTRADQRLEQIAARLLDRGLLTRDMEATFVVSEAGHRTFEQIVAGYRARLAQILERWSPEHHAEVRAMLNGLARELVAELPASSARRYGDQASR